MVNNNWLARTASFIKEKVSAYQFGYDAGDQSKRRKQISPNYQSEDNVLNSSQRAIVQADANDIVRNYSVVAWAVRQHLNYTTEFRFKIRTGNDTLDIQVAELMQDWSRPYNCDASKRHSLANLIRLAEARRVIDGDVGILRLSNGTIQLIESDRIRNPSGLTLAGDWLHGVQIGKAGEARSYAINSRTKGSGFTFERMVSAGNLHLLGYFSRNDQVRGVSPLTAALGDFRDVYESIGYAKAKAKVSQLFALAIYSDRADSLGAVTNEGAEGTEKDKYNVNLGKGPLTLELDPGDKAQFLESATPSTQFQDFQKVVLGAALKSIDLPYSNYDESYTHYSGSRSAMQAYEKSCQIKRRDIQDLLNRLTIWRLQLWLQDGTLTLPDSMSLRDVKFEWVPIAVPWWDASKETDNAITLIRNGLTTPQQVAKKLDSDFYDNIEETAEAVAWAKDKGITLDFMGAAANGQNQQPIKQEAIEQAVENVLSRYMKLAG